MMVRIDRPDHPEIHGLEAEVVRVTPYDDLVVRLEDGEEYEVRRDEVVELAA